MELTIGTGLLLAVLLAAAAGDIRYHRIPNELCYTVFGLFLAGAALDALGVEFGALRGTFWSHLASFAITFVVTAILFYRGLFGGGDTKLISAAAVWFPLAVLPKFVIGVAIAGGIWGLLLATVAVLRALPEGGGFKQALGKAGRTKIAYGPAILAGACFAILTG